MDLGLIFPAHRADAMKGMTGIIRCRWAPNFYSIHGAALVPFNSPGGAGDDAGGERAIIVGISGNSTVCDCFDYFKHEVHVR